MLVTGCATTTPAPSSRTEADVRSTLAQLTRAFEQNREADFFAFFDRTAYPNFEAAQEEMRLFLHENHEIVLDLIMDRVLFDEDKAVAAIRWDRSHVDPAGNHKLAEGQASFHLTRSPSGRLSLRLIEGASPFIRQEESP